jgi:hypothetical protein
VELKPTAITKELAQAALACQPLSQALKLAEWVGDGKAITASQVLRPAEVAEACAALGITLPHGKKKVRSAQDVPELDAAWDVARNAGLITLNAKQAFGLGFQDLTEDPAAALGAWLRAVTASFELPDDPCDVCLTVLAVLGQADDGDIELVKVLGTVFSMFHESPEAYLCPDCGEVHTPADYDEDEEDTGRHVAIALAGLHAFGAVTFTGDDGSVLTLTPLGRMLADTVYAAFAPSAEDSPAAVVARLAVLPAGSMVLYARDWLAARTPVDAARELIRTAESATPLLRAAAFDLATEIGPRAIPALREHAEVPGYGAYARQWLAELGEDVPVFARDEAWMQAEEMSALIERAPEGFAALALQTAMMQAGPGYSAELVKALRESGHPDAPRLLEMVRGRGENIRHTPKAPDNAKPLQLMITLRWVDDPPVWRRVAVPGSTTLSTLHDIIQSAMGWENDHMHAFFDGSTELSDHTLLRDVLPRRRSSIQYNYDFGDDWIHEIKSEGFYHNDIGTPLPFILDGGGACPPEDCGGPYRYDYLKSEILADPDHEEHGDMLDWLGIDSARDFNPDEFSVDEANAHLTWLRSSSDPARRSIAAARSSIAQSPPAPEDDLSAKVIRLQPRSKKPKSKR